MDDKGTNYIALAIPVFFISIAIEILVARHQRRELYRFNDTVNDLSTGILQQITGVFAQSAIYFGYFFIYDQWRLFDIPISNPWTWIVGFLGVDFCYYWFHRLSHEINLIWASHITHHQSEEYNLSVALRQSATQAFFSAPFYWPLAVIGLPPVPFLALSSFNTLYQFWIHTRAIGKMWAPFEYIFNTPSHHRVHHGCNPEYIDRNHAGTLIIWDRMFGSFEPERAEVIYGVTKPLKSWNPIWANLHYYIELGEVAAKTKRWRDKFLIWIMPPHWRPADVPMEDEPQTPLKGFKYNAHAGAQAHWYVGAQFTTVVLATVGLLFYAPQLSWWGRGLIAGYVAWTLVNAGATFEAKTWLRPSEVARLSAAATLPWLTFTDFGSAATLNSAISAWCAVSLVWLVGFVPRSSPEGVWMSVQRQSSN